LFFTCLAFFIFSEFGLLCWEDCRFLTSNSALITSDNPGKERCIVAVPLSDPSWNCIRSNTWLQIKGHKNQHVHPAAWNVLHLLRRYDNTIIYCFIALLELLYRWHHKSQKLWIPPHRWLGCRVFTTVQKWAGIDAWTCTAALFFSLRCGLAQPTNTKMILR
jgi:hypothetical protein